MTRSVVLKDGQIHKIIRNWAVELNWSGEEPENLTEVILDYFRRLYVTRPTGSFRDKMLEAALEYVDWEDIAREIIERVE